MKSTILAIIFCAVALSFVRAGEPVPGIYENCKAYADIAKTMMTRRQNGVPFSVLADHIQKYKEHEDKSKMYLYEAFMPLLIEAYNRPAYQTQRNKLIEVREFENKAMMTCMGVILSSY